MPVKGLGEKTDELDKGKGLKKREIPGRVHYKFITDVNKNLVIAIKNCTLLSKTKC